MNEGGPIEPIQFASPEEVSALIAMAESVARNETNRPVYELTLVSRLGQIVLSALGDPRDIVANLNVTISDGVGEPLVSYKFAPDGSYVPDVAIIHDDEPEEAEDPDKPSSKEIDMLRLSHAVVVIDSVVDYWTQDDGLLDPEQADALRWVRDGIAIIEQANATGTEIDRDSLFPTENQAPHAKTLFDFTIENAENRVDVREFKTELDGDVHLLVQFSEFVSLEKEEDEVVAEVNGASLFVHLDDPVLDRSSIFHAYPMGRCFAFQVPLEDYTDADDVSDLVVTDETPDDVVPGCERAAVEHITAALFNVSLNEADWD